MVLLSPESELLPSLHLRLSRLYLGSILRFPLSPQGLVLFTSTHLALWSDLEIRLFQLKLAENAFGPIPLEGVASNETTLCVQASAYSFGRAIL